MIKWLLNSKADQDRKKARDESLKLALDSTSALEKAAKGTMTLAQDVTETLQAKLNDYAEQIDQTSRIISDALLLVDAKGVIESFNPAAELMFGWKKRQILGKDIGIIFQFTKDTIINAKFMEEFLGKVNQDDEFAAVHHEEFMGRCYDGSEIFIDVSANQFARSDKKIFYLVLVRNVTHRVRNQKMMNELAEKNQELLTSIDASNTGFMILENDGTEYNVTFVNEGFARVTNMKRAALKRMNLRDFLGVDQNYWAVRRTLGESITARHELQLTLENTKEIWFDVHITPVIKGRSVIQWILVFYDITELKKAYSDLRRSEHHFRAFSDASSESMFIHNYQVLLDWNERAHNLTGYNNDELSKMNPFDLLHPLEREKVMAEANMYGDKSYETLFMSKTGDIKEVAINSRAIEWDNAEARISIVRDVSEYKDINTQLKTAKERYRTVIDNTIDMVICFNSDLEITFSNQTFRDYYDVDVEDLNGFSLLEIIPETDHKKFQEYMLGITPGTEVRRGIHRVQRHNEVRWQDWIDRGIFDSEGNLIEIQSVARDITHLMPNQS